MEYDTSKLILGKVHTVLGLLSLWNIIRICFKLIDTLDFKSFFHMYWVIFQ